MSTRITAVDHRWALNGSPEKHLVEAPNGRLWAAIHTKSGGGKFFYSENQGSTWTHSSASDLTYSQDNTILSMFIDAEGYAHVVWFHWDASPQHIHYSRGTPSSDGRRFSWKTTRLTPAAGRLGLDPDIVVFRRGTGWVVWIYFEYHDVASRLARIDVSANGSATVISDGIALTGSEGVLPFGGLEFAHTGDGVTPQTEPHVFVIAGARRSNSDGTLPDLRLHRGRYQSGDWTFGTSVLLQNAHIEETTALCVWDGSLLCAAWSPTNSTAVFFATWDGLATSVTRNDLPATPTGYGVINGLSMAHDPITDDLFVFVHDVTDGDILYSRLSRSTNAWSAWTVLVTRTADSHDNKVQALRHPRFGNIDILYLTLSSSSSGRLHHQRAIALSRKPGVPTLVSPPNGSLRDLSNGATFIHDYVPSGPGDSQQAWAFRRTHGTVTEWWNAGSQAWVTAEFMNAGADESTSFPAPAWPADTTYAWTVKTRSATGVDSDYASERTVTSTVAPVIDVTSPEGLIYTESTPLVEWSYTATEPMRSYEVRIVVASSTIDPLNPGPAVWTSGVVTSSVARAHRVDTPIDPDVGYRAYVKATSTAGLASTWAYNDFSLSLTPPSGPLVGVIEDYAYPSDIPRARLNVVTRTNYLDTEQDFGQVGWEALTNCTVAAQPVDLTSGLQASLKITSAAAGAMAARTVAGSPPTVAPDLPQPLGPLDFPVRPGQTYTAVADLRANTEARAGRLAIQWWDNDEGAAGAAIISTSIGAQVNTTTTSYTKASATAAAPEGARLGRLVVEGLGAIAAGEIFYATRMSFHPGDVAQWQPGGFSETQTVRVERSDDDGVTWRKIIDRIRPDFWQNAFTIDRTMRHGLPVLYRAYTDVDLDDGSKLSSGVSPTSLAIIDADDWIIRDPDDEFGEVYAFVTDISRKDAEAATVHRPAGREYPVIDSEGVQSPEGTLELFVRQSMIAPTVELLRRPKVLIVQSPVGQVLKLRFLQRDLDIDMSVHRTLSLNYYEME